MKLIKKLLVLSMLILTLFISIKTKDNKIYYISLGDGLSLGLNENDYISIGYSDFIRDYLENNKRLKFYTKDFSNKDLRITDLINNINDNYEINVDNNDLSIQNALNKANLITISLGTNELLYKYKENTSYSYLYDYIDSFIEDYKKLIKMIKKYNNKEIIILGIYNPTFNKDLDKFIIYTNDKLINMCNDEKIEFIDLYSLFQKNKKFIYNLNNTYPNYDGYKLISKEIIKIIKNNLNKK